jgi:hypothetical protein
MKRIRIIGLALVAVFALSALVASAASAATVKPEFVPANGKFPVAFTGTSGAGKLETIGKRTISCKTDSITGSIASAGEANKVIVTFKGCTTKLLFFTGPCNTPGNAAEEIVTNELKGIPYYKSISGKTAVILTEPSSGTTFASIECVVAGQKEKLTVKGSGLGSVGTTNSSKTTNSLSSTLSSGVQTPNEYEYESGKTVKNVLPTTEGSGAENFSAESSGVEGTENLTFSQAVNVKA